MKEPTLWGPGNPLLLASGSVTRRDMLAAAGIPVDVARPQIDERSLEASMGQEVDASDIARALAAAKAISVSSLHRDRYVLAADQTLDCQGQRFHKPADRTEAATQLMQLAGRSHRLHSAFALARDGRILTEGEQSADLVMRAFDDAFVARYLALAGTGVLGSVGCYRLEGLGAQLFERIDGDHFTILGLPLLPVLAALRAQGCLVS